MSNDWLPNDVDEPRPRTDRGPLYFLIASVTILFLVVAVLFFQLMIRQGRNLATAPPATPHTSAPATAATTPAASSRPQPSETASPTATPTAKLPAPEGAIEAASFTTPAKNVHCRINSDNVECSIYAYDYPSPGQCEGITATYVVGTEGTVEADCTHFVKTNEVFDYGTAVAKNGFACTLEKNGITCWSEKSGHGFELKRATDRLF